MCFSAGASFAGGALIVATGVLTIRKVRKPSMMLFAGIPLLFGIQQFSEGVVWVTLRSGGHEVLQYAATLIFLIMALIVWPIMMPLSAIIMEPVRRRKRIILAFLTAGAVVSAYYSYCMLTFDFYPVIDNYHIKYNGEWPKHISNPAFILYLAATIAPLFISSIRRMSIMGLLILFSCLITGIFYKEYLTSVWCFFAALISVVILWIIRDVEVERAPDYIEATVKA